METTSTEQLVRFVLLLQTSDLFNGQSADDTLGRVYREAQEVLHLVDESHDGAFTVEDLPILSEALAAGAIYDPALVKAAESVLIEKALRVGASRPERSKRTRAA